MTIQTDVQEPTAMSDDAAVAALVNQMKVAPKAPTASSGEDEEEPDLDEEAGEEEVLEADDGEEADEGEEGDEEDGEADPDDEGEEEDGEAEETPPAATAPADDAVVKVTVNGEETEVTVGSLKRLAGQEATLTRKSQEADAVGGRAAMMIQGALDTIVEDLEPYKGIDWLVARDEMDPEEFKWHRENFTRAEGRYNALVKQAGEFETTIKGRRDALIAEQAKEANVELTADIPGWSEKLYGDIMTYAVSQGLEQEDVSSICNAKVIKLLHKAMVADKATAVVAKKVNKAPARVKKPSSFDEADTGVVSGRSQRKLEQKMASGRGTDDDAVALLMGRWKTK